MKFPYQWQLTDGYPAHRIEPHHMNVFGTFVCGGGSTMGYKLAGYHHLGGIELDPEMAEIYQANHHPEHLFVEDIRAFNERDDLPNELYNLDLLDGSPPCSSFSMLGRRDKDWHRTKEFREGQVAQRLDDLVFIYVDTIKKLQPKVALLENVKGLIAGNAKAYAKKLNDEFAAAGYRVQAFLLNAASMGVPQRRERVFFIGIRNDLPGPPLKLIFNERQIKYREFKLKELGKPLTTASATTWRHHIPSDKSFAHIHMRLTGKNKRFNAVFIDDNVTPQTLCAGADSIPIRRDHPNRITDKECCFIGSFPTDYNFLKMVPNYLIGMSVPPVMIAQISHQIHQQWLKGIYDHG